MNIYIIHLKSGKTLYSHEETKDFLKKEEFAGSDKPIIMNGLVVWPDSIEAIEVDHIK